MKAKNLVMTALALVLAMPAHAQTVDELIEKNIKAKGGMEKIKAVKSVRATGTMSLGEMQAPFTMTMKRPNEMRMEFTLQGMTGIQAYDGTTAWSVMPFMGKKDPEPMAGDEAKMVAEQSEFDGPLIDYKARGNKVELVGRETVEGVEAYKLKVTRKDGEVRYIFLDPDAYLEIRMEATRKVRGTEMEVESTIGDYKDVGGVMMAHSVESGAKGMPQRQKMTIEKYEVNVEVPETAFAMPAKADSSAAGAAATTATKAASAKPATDAKPATAKKK